MTIDEELSLLEDQMRRLKVEYDIYFGGGSKKPPSDIEWKVKNLLRKYSDGGRMNFGQRFRYNTVQQRYALYNALWQQKLQIKEEGYRRPQDAVLGIQGLRDEQAHQEELARKHQAVSRKDSHFNIAGADAADTPQIESLFAALAEARRQTGEKSAADLASFRKFVHQKTSQLRKQYGCTAVEYSVETQGGKVKLKARPKT